MNPFRALLFGSLVVASVCFHPACSKGGGTDDTGPIDVAAWVKAHEPAVATLRAQLDAAANLVKDLPAATVHVADPEVPIKPITEQWGDGENTVMLSGASVRGLPEFGRDDGKSVEKGETSISVAYTGYVDLASAFSMVDKGEPRFTMNKREGVGLAKKIAKIRYAIIAREVSYTPGAIDTTSKTFTPGSYEGVAHVVDLQGPKHLGSVAFKAANTGSFESYEGSEEFMFKADLSREAIRALHAELRKTLPMIQMPEPPDSANP